MSALICFYAILLRSMYFEVLHPFKTTAYPMKYFEILPSTPFGEALSLIQSRQPSDLVRSGLPITSLQFPLSSTLNPLRHYHQAVGLVDACCTRG